MKSKISELTEKIYSEGVEKAQDEAKKIMTDAREKAEALIRDAEKKAGSIIREAERKSEEISRNLKKELQSISGQVIAITKQKITDSIVADSSKTVSDKLLNDNQFLKSLMLEVVRKWDLKSGSVDDLSLVMSQEQIEELEEMFKSGTLQVLKKKKQIIFDPSIKKGFQIISNTEGFKISFTDEDLENFFKRFMKPRIQEYLFTSASDA